MDKTILVVGGTGMLGRPVALKLKKEGFKVKILTRDVKTARIKLTSNFDLVEGDVSDPESLDRAMENCYGVHINLQGGPRPSDFDRVERRGTENVVKSALKNGVKKITYISGSSVNRTRLWFAPTRAKYYAEQSIINGNIPYIIFRASWFMESLPKYIRNNKAMVIGKNKNPYHWIAAEDFAELVSKVYTTDEYDFSTMPVYGPEKYTMLEAMEKYCSIKHPDIKPSVVPTGIMRLVSGLTFNTGLKFVTALSRYFEKVEEDDNYDARIDNYLGRDAITIEKWSKEYSLV